MNRIIYTLLATSLIVLSGCGERANDEVVKETYIHKYGVNVSKKDWESRGSDGQVIQTLRSGTVITKSYEAGTLEGIITRTFPHSQTVQKVEIYADGTLVKETENYPSGLPKQENEYISENEYKTTMWYENGSPRAIEGLQGTLLADGKYYICS